MRNRLPYFPRPLIRRGSGETRSLPPAGKVRSRRAAGGYSLVEVLIAAGIVALGIGAAALLALTMVSQQEGSARVVRALNYQEQAARLYQLGVPSMSITGIMPAESSVTSLAFTDEANVVHADIGTNQTVTCTVVINTPSLFGSGSDLQTNRVYLVRPHLR